MRTFFAVLAGFAVALESANAYRSGPMRTRLARPGAPAVARVSAMSAPRALPRMDAAPVELCDSDDPEEVCMLPMGVTVPMSIVNTLKVGLSFATWFFLNVMYNLTNKKCQNVFPMPWTMTVVSLFVGIPYVLFMWATGLRPAPKVSMEGYKKLFPIGVFHAAGHASAVIALGAGAVSFAQIVKTGEPVFTCLLSFLVLGQTFSPLVYATLLPIVGGVALASLKELSFTWTVSWLARPSRARMRLAADATARTRRAGRGARGGDRTHDARAETSPAVLSLAPASCRALASTSEFACSVAVMCLSSRPPACVAARAALSVSALRSASPVCRSRPSAAR